MAELNEQQHRASRPAGGVELVIAGAGTGKTKTLVEKVKNILGGGMAAPGEVLILTFSRKAAEELRERVSAGIDPDTEGLTAGTFHSFCLALLREHGDLFIERFGFTRFPDVLDGEASRELLKKILEKKLDILKGIPVPVALSLIDRINMLDSRTREKLSRAGILEVLRGIIEEYRCARVARNALDDRDMIEYAIRLLRECGEVREKVRNRYRYVLVDEFQDTSEMNFTLLRLILPEEKVNLFAVGDDWQSIYGFRDARIEYILSMGKYFPGASVHRLTRNYRSRKEIVALSNRFIKRNRYRTRKKLVSEKGKGGRVTLHEVENFHQEASLVAGLVKKGMTFSADIAILYRNNIQGGFLRERLGSEIPGDNVRFMTMHGSKGLEFDVVIIAGLSDRVIPDRSSDIEEERRLLYVSMTRAREHLHVISHLNEDGSPGVFARELGLDTVQGYG